MQATRRSFPLFKRTFVLFLSLLTPRQRHRSLPTISKMILKLEHWSNLKEFLSVSIEEHPLRHLEAQGHLSDNFIAPIHHQRRPIQHHSAPFHPCSTITCRVPFLLGRTPFNLRGTRGRTRPAEASAPRTEMVLERTETAILCGTGCQGWRQEAFERFSGRNLPRIMD